jgi:hypothetical protein
MKLLRSAFALTLLLAALAIPLWAVDGPLTALMNLRGRVDSSGYLLVDCPACSGGSSSGGTLTNNNAAPSTANMGVLGCVANAAAPTLTETYQNLASCDLHGATRTLLMDSSGAVVSFLTASQGGAAAVGAAMPTNTVAIGGIGGTTTNGVMTPIIVCDQQAFLDMTSATTTELIALTSGQTVHICHIRATANGTTTMTLKKGTGSNCGTGTAAIDNAIELTAQTGYVAGIGVGEVLSGVTAANAVCVTNSGSVNLHVFVKYAKY